MADAEIDQVIDVDKDGANKDVPKTDLTNKINKVILLVPADKASDTVAALRKKGYMSIEVDPKDINKVEAAVLTIAGTDASRQATHKTVEEVPVAEPQSLVADENKPVLGKVLPSVAAAEEKVKDSLQPPGFMKPDESVTEADARYNANLNRKGFTF